MFCLKVHKTASQYMHFKTFFGGACLRNHPEKGFNTPCSSRSFHYPALNPKFLRSPCVWSESCTNC